MSANTKLEIPTHLQHLANEDNDTLEARRTRAFKEIEVTMEEIVASTRIMDSRKDS